MAQLLAAKSQADYPPFCKPAHLAANKTHFCIDSIKLHTHEGKEQWYLNIHYVEEDEVVSRTLSLDHSQKRDEDFGFLLSENDFPQHDVWLEKASFKNATTGMQQTSYRHKQGGDSASCACNWGSGETTEPPATEEFP
jgi:hypothetical protein